MTTAAIPAPDTSFWQRCREEAARTGRPAWLLAEEWRHDDNDKPVDTQRT